MAQSRADLQNRGSGPRSRLGGVRSAAPLRVNPLCCQVGSHELLVARRCPSADGFRPGSSQIRAALRCFLSRTGDEKPHRNAKYAYLCAVVKFRPGSTHQQPTRGASRPELRAVRSARDTNDVQSVDRVQNSDNNPEVVASEWQLPPFCDCRKEYRS